MGEVDWKEKFAVATRNLEDETFLIYVSSFGIFDINKIHLFHKA